MLSYYEPMFPISSAQMPFTIRIETILRDTVEPQSLRAAVDQALRRYPYFAVQVEKVGEDLLAVPNPRPVVVREGNEIEPLGSEAVNGHLLALTYCGKQLCFYTSHVITDGGGFFPFIKTVLYLYLCLREKKTLDPKGFRMTDEPFYADELGNPYPEEAMAKAEPFYQKKPAPYFRLRDGGYVNDHKGTVYRVRLDEATFMRFNFDNDGSPCALLSVLMAKAIWKLHPQETKDIVSAVSFNLRPGLRNMNSYRLLSSSIPLTYPNRMREDSITRLCTCSRGMTSLLTQPENVLYYAQKRRERVDAWNRLPDLQTRKAVVGKAALEDSIANTFSVSYVGKVGLGSVEPYLDAMYNVTDGSTYETLFIEVSAINGWFDLAFIQGFSNDIYYRTFLQVLTENGLSYVEEAAEPLLTPKMELPE